MQVETHYSFLKLGEIKKTEKTEIVKQLSCTAKAEECAKTTSWDSSVHCAIAHHKLPPLMKVISLAASEVSQAEGRKHWEPTLAKPLLYQQHVYNKHWPWHTLTITSPQQVLQWLKCQQDSQQLSTTWLSVDSRKCMQWKLLIWEELWLKKTEIADFKSDQNLHSPSWALNRCLRISRKSWPQRLWEQFTQLRAEKI